MTPLDLSLYLVTDTDQLSADGRDGVAAVRAAVAGGVTAVQVREKDTDGRRFLAQVEAIAGAIPEHVTLLVNDRVDVFLAARARGARVSGVHIGQRDLPAEAVRSLIGADAVLGVTANTAAELRAVETGEFNADYVGIGAVRGTRSKSDAPEAIGVDGVSALARACRLPAVAIGGVEPSDLGALRAGGLAGAAVVSWICASEDPRLAAEQLADAWRAAA